MLGDQKTGDNQHHRIHSKTKMEMDCIEIENEGQKMDQAVHRTATQEREQIHRTPHRRLGGRGEGNRSTRHHTEGGGEGTDPQDTTQKVGGGREGSDPQDTTQKVGGGGEGGIRSTGHHTEGGGGGEGGIISTGHHTEGPQDTTQKVGGGGREGGNRSTGHHTEGGRMTSQGRKLPGARLHWTHDSWRVLMEGYILQWTDSGVY